MDEPFGISLFPPDAWYFAESQETCGIGWIVANVVEPLSRDVIGNPLAPVDVSRQVMRELDNSLIDKELGTIERLTPKRISLEQNGKEIPSRQVPEQLIGSRVLARPRNVELVLDAFRTSDIFFIDPQRANVVSLIVSIVSHALRVFRQLK